MSRTWAEGASLYGFGVLTSRGEAARWAPLHDDPLDLERGEVQGLGRLRTYRGADSC